MTRRYKTTISFASQLLPSYLVRRIMSRSRWCRTCTGVDSEGYAGRERKRKCHWLATSTGQRRGQPGSLFAAHFTARTFLRFCNTGNIKGDVDGKLKQQRQSTGLANDSKRNKWPMATPPSIYNLRNSVSIFGIQQSTHAFSGE